MKLSTLVIIIVVALAVVGVGIYFLMHQNNAAPAPSTGQTGSLPNAGNQQIGGNGQPTTGNQQPNTTSAHFGVISNDPVLDYFVDAKNNVAIVRPDGIIETVTNNQGSSVSTSTFSDIATAAFSYDGKKVLINTMDSSGSQASVFDLGKKSWSKLVAKMQGPVWAPASYQVSFLQNAGPGSETISTINAGSPAAKATVLATITAQDLALQWPNKTTLMLADKPSVYTAGSVWAFNIPNQTITPLVQEYQGLESIWSNTTSTLGLVFAGGAQNSGGHLSLIESKGNQKALTFATLPSKCVFAMAAGNQPPATSSQLAIFCAVPRDQQTFSIARLPDEYEQKILFTADDLYKVNTADGTLSVLFNDPNQTVDATKLKVFNNTLFFVNRYDQKLYAVSLQ